jgi:hypothetical protein
MPQRHQRIALAGQQQQADRPDGSAQIRFAQDSAGAQARQLRLHGILPGSSNTSVACAPPAHLQGEKRFSTHVILFQFADKYHGAGSMAFCQPGCARNTA